MPQPRVRMLQPRVHMPQLGPGTAKLKKKIASFVKKKKKKTLSVICKIGHIL